MTAPAPPGKLGWAGTAIYGIGAIGGAAKTVPITSFLMLYYHQVIGLSALAISTVLMASLVLDAIWDPLVGQLSDTFRSRWGRRLPFMYLSIVPVTVLFLLLWMPPAGWPAPMLTAYLAVCVIGIRFFDTFFELPHVALVPELTSDYHERTRLFTARYLFEAAGGLTVTALAYNVFMKERPDGTGGLLAAEGYRPFAIFAATVIVLSLTFCAAGLHRRIVSGAPPSPARRRSLGDHLRDMAETLKSRSLAVLVAAAVFISIGSGIGSTLGIYWLMYFYRFTQAQITILTVPIMFGLLVIAAAPAISARLGKRRAAILLLWINAAAGAVPLLARLLDLLPVQGAGLLVLVGAQSVIGAGTMTMITITLSSMVADLVEEAEARTGRRSEGLLLASSSFMRKASQGLGTLGAGLLLMLAAFPQGMERDQVPAGVVDRMALLYLGVSLALTVITTLILSRYRGDRFDRTTGVGASGAGCH